MDLHLLLLASIAGMSMSTMVFGQSKVTVALTELSTAAKPSGLEFLLSILMR